MDPLSAWAYGGAATSTLTDGVIVGGWLATCELDDRPARRRRVRLLMSTVYVTQVLVSEIAWQVAVHPGDGAAESDRRALVRVVALAVGASAVLSTFDRRLPRALARHGVARPHRAFGAAVGLAYAACEAPIWHAQARGRLAALDARARSVPHDPEAWAFALRLREVVTNAVAEHPGVLDVEHDYVDEGNASTGWSGFGSSVRVTGEGHPAYVQIWYDPEDLGVAAAGDGVPLQTWPLWETAEQAACLFEVGQLVEGLAGSQRARILAAAQKRHQDAARRRRWRWRA